MEYPLIITPDDDDLLLVTSPDFPELVSFAEDENAALFRGGLALEEAIAARMDSFEDIPAPSTVGEHFARVPLALDLKVQLFWALRDAGLSRADLVRLTGWPRNKVDRLFDPNHESKLAQLEAAFAALKKTVHVRMDAA